MGSLPASNTAPLASSDIASIIGGVPSSSHKCRQLQNGGPGRVDVAAGEQDLDTSDEQSCSLGRKVMLPEGAVDRCSGGHQLTLAQPQQRQAGLGAVAGVARPAVQVTGGPIVAA